MQIYMSEQGSDLWLTQPIHSQIDEIVDLLWQNDFTFDIAHSRLQGVDGRQRPFEQVYSDLVDVFCSDQMADLSFTRIVMFTLKRRYPTALRLRLFKAIDETMPQLTVASNGRPWLINGSWTDYLAIDSEPQLQNIYRRLIQSDIVHDDEIRRFLSTQVRGQV